MTAKEFSDTVLSELSNAGWDRRGKSAWIRCADADIIVELQKSKYDDSVFVNIGITLRHLEHAEPPKYHGCHLQFRAARLISEFPDIESENINVLRAAVQSKEPDLRGLGNLDVLRSMASVGGLQGGLIRKEAREALGIV